VLPEARPLTRGERYLAFVRDSNARARAAAAQARLDGGQMSDGREILHQTGLGVCAEAIADVLLERGLSS
jgi:hypothetical protein